MAEVLASELIDDQSCFFSSYAALCRI